MPILPPNVLDFVSHSLEQTTRLGARLGELALPGDMIALSGELGAGKTAFATGFGLGFGAREPVTSPTFVFAHEHRRVADRVRLYHIDCYRLNAATDADSIGLSDMLMGDTVLLVEWPERILPLLPAGRLWITLEPIEDEPTRRRIQFQAVGDRSEALLDMFRRRAFGG